MALPTFIVGHDGVTKHLADIYDTAEYRVELEECIEEGDLVVVSVRFVGRGALHPGERAKLRDLLAKALEATLDDEV